MQYTIMKFPLFIIGPAVVRFLAAALVCVGLAAPASALQSIAFYYGADAPLDELHAFDVAVVDPDHGFDPVSYRSPSSELFAYVSVGEVNPSRAYASRVKAEWRMGGNAAWGSTVIDQRQSGWRDFFTEQIVAPLWTRGFRGFFLDTLDSYQLAGEHADPAAQRAGLIALIHGLRQRFPGIRLIANRGFELFPEVAPDVEAVAAESLFRSWDQTRGNYVPVSAQDREWLLTRLQEIQSRYRLPVISIDYVAPADRELGARDGEADPRGRRRAMGGRRRLVHAGRW